MSKRSRRRAEKTASSASAEVDVVIITGGRFDMLQKCLTALTKEAENVPLNVWVMDNASDAEERLSNEDLFRSSYPWLNSSSRWSKRVTQSQGFPSANNEMARMGSAKIILFLNDDVELMSGAISTLLKQFEDPKVGIVGIKLLFPEDSMSPIRPAGKVQHVGVSLSLRGSPIHPLVGWSKDNPKTCRTMDVWAVTGACLAVRRELFGKIGGFDPVYGMGTWEDVELCLRARQLGFRIVLDATAQGYHYTGATSEKKQVPFPLMSNMQIFQSRWQGTNFMSWEEWKWW